MSGGLKDLFSSAKASKPAGPKPTSIRLTEAERAELQATADHLGIPVSDLLRWRNAWARDRAPLETMLEYLEPTGEKMLRMP